jgi:hypothetical protein
MDLIFNGKIASAKLYPLAATITIYRGKTTIF